MASIGVFLSSEEHGPEGLLQQARWAEEAGFDSLLISDHFHPWTGAQGESPFVWSVIGAIAGATGMKVTTGVTCPRVGSPRSCWPRPPQPPSDFWVDDSCSGWAPVRPSTSTYSATGGPPPRFVRT